MTPAALISHGRSFGVTLAVASSGKLRVTYDSKPPPADFVEALKAAKFDIIAHLQGLDAERQADDQPAANGGQPRPSGAGPVAPGEPPRFPSGVQLDTEGRPMRRPDYKAKKRYQKTTLTCRMARFAIWRHRARKQGFCENIMASVSRSKMRRYIYQCGVEQPGSSSGS